MFDIRVFLVQRSPEWYMRQLPAITIKYENLLKMTQAAEQVKIAATQRLLRTNCNVSGDKKL